MMKEKKKMKKKKLKRKTTPNNQPFSAFNFISNSENEIQNFVKSISASHSEKISG